jgi:hypothetical protein
MIEKVKANASSLAQDTNRLRAERDSYKRRLADTGESTTTASGDGATRRDREKETRRLKSSASAPLGGGRESPMPNGGRINDLRKLSDDGVYLSLLQWQLQPYIRVFYLYRWT